MSERKGAKGGAAAITTQSHLPPTPSPAQDASAHIDKLVSLTYDSNPDVRRKAAQELSQIDDPRAVFALLELGADKDPTVQDMARSSLDNFKGEERETLVSLEKIFEAKHEGKPLSEDMATARQKLMPSLEKYFLSKNKAVRDKMLPSLEKLFTWMPPAASASEAPSGSAPSSTPVAPAAAPASARPARRSAFEQVATAHLGESDADSTPTARAPLATSRPSASDEVRGDEDFAAEADELDDEEGDEEIRPSAPAPSAPTLDPLAGVEAIHSSKSILDRAEADVGIPVHLRSPQQLRRRAAGSAPSESELEAADDFPVPENLQDASPTSSLPLMGDSSSSGDAALLPRHALYYYKWAYAFTMTPGIKASEVKKERERLVKEAKRDIELAFDLAIKRTREEGIENLGSLQVGMKKVTTFPLEVVENTQVQIPHGKKMLVYSRLVLTDGQIQVPLYVVPPRAEGIRAGDLLSLRGAYVDKWSQPGAPGPEGTSEGGPVLLLGKNGQLVVTK